MPRFLAITLPGFKSKSGASTSLTAKNLEQHERDAQSQGVEELKAALAAKDEEMMAQTAQIEELRQRLAAAGAAKETDKTEAPESNVQEQAPEKAQDNAQDSGTWLSTAYLECV